MESTKKFLSYRKCFSLVELIVIFAVIAIIASLLQPSLKRLLSSSYYLKCSNNLRIHGIAIDQYAEDNENAVCMTFWPGTAKQFSVYHHHTLNQPRKSKANYQGSFHGGEAGYLEPYIGTNDDLYHCPSAKYEQELKDYSSGGFTGVNATYAGFAGFNDMSVTPFGKRTRDNFYMKHPVRDEQSGWDSKKTKIYLMDAVVNLGSWVQKKGRWDLEGAVIHNNSEPLPILMSDGQVFQLDRTVILDNPNSNDIINAVLGDL